MTNAVKVSKHLNLQYSIVKSYFSIVLPSRLILVVDLISIIATSILQFVYRQYRQ